MATPNAPSSAASSAPKTREYPWVLKVHFSEATSEVGCRGGMVGSIGLRLIRMFRVPWTFLNQGTLHPIAYLKAVGAFVVGSQLQGSFDAQETVTLSCNKKDPGGRPFTVQVRTNDARLCATPISARGDHEESVTVRDLTGGPYWLNVGSSGIWSIDLSGPSEPETQPLSEERSA
jgi:hypothetical protein